MTRRVPIPRASNVVVEAVRDWILSEHLQSGYKLPSEVEMMDMYGLGRTTVREAIRLLESEGLVEVKRGPAGGTFVRHADIRQVSQALTLLFSFRNTTLQEFVEFRRLVEPEMAALAADNATDEQREEILKVGTGHLASAGGSADLHNLVAEACGNGVLNLLMEAMQVPLARHFRPEHISEQNVIGTEVAHTKIAELIAEGSVERARRAMARHLDAYAAYVADEGLRDEPLVPRRLWAR